MRFWFFREAWTLKRRWSLDDCIYLCTCLGENLEGEPAWSFPFRVMFSGHQSAPTSFHTGFPNGREAHLHEKKRALVEFLFRAHACFSLCMNYSAPRENHSSPKLSPLVGAYLAQLRGDVEAPPPLSFTWLLKRGDYKKNFIFGWRN